MQVYPIWSEDLDEIKSVVKRLNDPTPTSLEDRMTMAARLERVVKTVELTGPLPPIQLLEGD